MPQMTLKPCVCVTSSLLSSGLGELCALHALTEVSLYPFPGSHPELGARSWTSTLCLGLFHRQVCGRPGYSSHVLWAGSSKGLPTPYPNLRKASPTPSQPHSVRRQTGREPQRKHPSSWSPPCANSRGQMLRCPGARC